MSSILSACKRSIAPALHQLSFLSGLSRYATRRNSAARVLMYHGVGGPDCPADLFESQIKYLKSNFSVISLRDAVDLSRHATRRFKTEVILTFDDGLRNNFTIVYPILCRYGLPATFFVCPELVETGKWQWAYEIEQRLVSSDLGRLEQICSALEIERQESVNRKTDIVDRIIEHMKTLETAHREKAEETIRSMTRNFGASAQQHGWYDTMSWDEMRSLSPELITIGSHTVNHPILTKLLPDEIKFQIVESKQWIQRALQRSIDYFCYPNGDYDASSLDIVSRNYVAAVTTRSGYFENGDDVYQINRIPAAETLPLFAWRMFRP